MSPTRTKTDRSKKYMDKIMNVCRFSHDIIGELLGFNQMIAEVVSCSEDEHLENTDQPEDISSKMRNICSTTSAHSIIVN